ncbi:hypothetical protein [uncultured Nitrospira sp.]|uniref:hypothetical protein n=1 Tax=uncultured Nitrospira sp. TaxID=157176 RepID=UPI0031401250
MVCKRFFAEWFRTGRLFYFRLVLATWWGIFGSASIVFGAEWSVEPAFVSEGRFYDNLRITTQPHHSTWAMKVSPSATLNYATEILTLKANPKFEYARYYSRDPIKKTFNNYFLPLSGSYRTEVDRLGLDVDISRDNALFAELQETGVLTNFIPRNRRNVRGSWDRSLTERLTLPSSYQFTDVTYDQSGSSSLRDYQVHTGTFGADYHWSEETRVRGSAYYSNYHVPQNSLRYQTPGFELGFSHRIFETFSLSGSGGFRYVRTTLDGNGQQQTDNQLTWLYGMSLKKEWERSHLTVGFSRALNPSGFGVLFVTDRVDLTVDHQLTHALKASLGGMFTNNDKVGSSSDDSGVSNSRYWQISPALSWSVTEDWSLDLTYRYAQRTIKSSSEGTAHSNAVFLAFTCTLPKWAASR